MNFKVYTPWMNVMGNMHARQSGFKADNNYDVAIRMLGSLNKDEYRTITASQEIGSEPPVFACRFCKVYGYENLLALANEEGAIVIQDTSLSNPCKLDNMVTKTQGHLNAIFDLAWSPHSLRLVSVSGDHTAIMWDVSRNNLDPLSVFEGHSRSVKVASFHPTDINVFATGARDGMVILWDYRCSQQNTLTIRPDNVISNAHCPPGSSGKKTRRREPSRADSITGLVFQDENHLISCSAGDGVIKVWDTRKCYSVYKRVPQPCASLSHPGDSGKTAFTSLSVDPGGVRLYANCMDNNIYCYNIAGYNNLPIAQYYGHTNQTFYTKSCLSGDGQYLLSGSADTKAYIWNVRHSSQPLATLVGHYAEVTCVDWADNKTGDIRIVTCADDSCHKVWQVYPPNDKLDLSEFSGRVQYQKDFNLEKMQLKGEVKQIYRTSRLSRPSWRRRPHFTKRLRGTAEQWTKEVYRWNYDPDECRRYPEGLTGPLSSIEEELAVIRAHPRTKKKSELTCWLENMDDSFINPTKKLKLTPITPVGEGNEKPGAAQPRTEGKARRLFDLDDSSHCSGVEILSPTSNLPNYVIDGTSPYHRCCSSAGKQKENWLSKLQATPSPKLAEKVTTKRRSQSSPKVCRGNLLKFFKVAAKQSPGSNNRDTQKESSNTQESPSIM